MSDHFWTHFGPQKRPQNGPKSSPESDRKMHRFLDRFWVPLGPLLGPLGGLLGASQGPLGRLIGASSLLWISFGVLGGFQKHFEAYTFKNEGISFSFISFGPLKAPNGIKLAAKRVRRGPSNAKPRKPQNDDPLNEKSLIFQLKTDQNQSPKRLSLRSCINVRLF